MGCYNSTVINAPADKIWDAIKNFHDLSWSANVITKVDVVGDKNGNEPGAKRILNDAFQETLISVNDEEKYFTYSIDDGPAAVARDNVNGFVVKAQVFPNTANGKSFVIWTAQWESSVNGGVAELCDPIYAALLGDMKAHFKK